MAFCIGRRLRMPTLVGAALVGLGLLSMLVSIVLVVGRWIPLPDGVIVPFVGPIAGVLFCAIGVWIAKRQT